MRKFKRAWQDIRPFAFRFPFSIKILCSLLSFAFSHVQTAFLGLHFSSGGILKYINKYLFSVAMLMALRTVVLSKLFAEIERSTSAECGVAAKIRANAVVTIVNEADSSVFAR